MSIGSYLRNEIAGPLDADFFIGLPPSEEPGGPSGALHGRRASGRTMEDLLERSGEVATGGGTDLAQLAELALTYLAPDGPLFKALMAPGGALSDQDLWQSPRLHQAEIPAANGICDARSLARLYGACVSEVTTGSGWDSGSSIPNRSISPYGHRRRGRTRCCSVWTFSGGSGSTSTEGSLPPPVWAARARSGISVWAGRSDGVDPDAELAMGYVMNRMELGTTGDTRSFRLMQACLAAVRP